MRVGIYQCAGAGLTPEQRLQRLRDALEREQLELVVCPELFMSGYDVGDSLLELAEPRGGPFFQEMARLAQASNTAIVYGYPERDGETLYNSAACIDPNGELLANHRKLLLPPGFEQRYFETGDTLTLFELNNVRFGLLICYDAEFPEAVRRLGENGAQAVVVPTATIDSWQNVALQMIPTRAFENGIWLLYANHAGRENRSHYLGASCIIAPDGTDAARAGAHETLISATLDPTKVTAAQTRLPYIAAARLMRDVVGNPQRAPADAHRPDATALPHLDTRDSPPR